jgi:HAE1 family hydrophobic/amphiphilic exporter-1
MSLLVSFTLTPLLASRFGRIEILDKHSWWGSLNLGFEQVLDSCKQQYARLLGWSLQHKGWLFSFVLLLFVFTGMLFKWGLIGFSFIEGGDRGQLTISLELGPSTSMYQTNMVAQQAEKMLLRHKEVQNVFSNVGFSSEGNTGGISGNSNVAELNVTLVDKNDRKISSQQFGVMIQKEMSTIVGLKVKTATVGLVGNTEDAPIQISVKGQDRLLVRKTAEMVKHVVEQVPGTQSVEFSVEDPKPEIEIN